METPEIIKLSLQQGEWDTSLDFSDASHSQMSQVKEVSKVSSERSNQRNCLLNLFIALPFGLAMAPLKFTEVLKKVKLMAQARGIRIH